MGSFSEILWFEQAALPWLALLQLLPLCGASVVFALQERPAAVTAGKVFALGELLLCSFLALRIDALAPALQFAERLDAKRELADLLAELQSMQFSLYEVADQIDKNHYVETEIWEEIYTEKRRPISR